MRARVCACVWGVCSRVFVSARVCVGVPARARVNCCLGGVSPAVIWGSSEQGSASPCPEPVLDGLSSLAGGTRVEAALHRGHVVSGYGFPASSFAPSLHRLCLPFTLGEQCVSSEVNQKVERVA